MNRRNILFGLLASLLGGLFVGWRRYGKASPKAVALSHNGIISLKRTPNLLGCKVYVDGKLIKRAIMVNTTKGFCLAYVNDRDWGSMKSLERQRIYGYIEIDEQDCKGRILTGTPYQLTEDGESQCNCCMVACCECRPRYIKEHPAECECDLEILKARSA